MKIDRLLSIVILLLDRERVTAAEIARRYEVSIRTAMRDLETLGNAGIPVVSRPGHEGGFSLMPGYRVDRRLLSETDISTIVNSLQELKTPFAPPAGTVEKIRSLRKAEVARNPVTLDLLPWGGGERLKPLLLALKSAVEEHRVGRFSYRGWNGVDETREAEPYRLMFKGSAWYLYARCRSRQDFRLFRADRIRAFTVLPEIFVHREAPEPDFSSFQWKNSEGTVTALKFRTAAKERLLGIWPEDEIREEPDGALYLNVRFPDESWVIPFLVSFGDDLEVISPPETRLGIRQWLKKIEAIYSGDEI